MRDRHPRILRWMGVFFGAGLIVVAVVIGVVSTSPERFLYMAVLGAAGLLTATSGLAQLFPSRFGNPDD